jgi:putative SbcD/Mre11-related phosphoesterase
MEIVKGIEVIDLALYLKKEKILIIADTHIGYEEALNKQGVLIPRFQFKEIIKRLEKIVGKRKIDKIIINGDIKHEFGRISEQEWRHTLRLLDFLSKYCKEIILVKGNHDTILGPIAEKRKVKVVDCVVISSDGVIKPLGIKSMGIKSLKNNLLIIHGDKINENILKIIKKNNIKIIIGHEHPAVSIHEGVRTELFKCFLKGKWKKRTLIVQPSFNLVTEGTDIVKEELLSPFLKQDLSSFECFIVGDKVYEFGKLSKFYKE